MDGPGDDHTKLTKSEKDKHHMISLICRISKKKELMYKTQIDTQM